MTTVSEKQLFLLELIQEKILLSKNNRILIKLAELKDFLEPSVTFLSALQKAGVLCVTGIEKIKEPATTFLFNIPMPKLQLAKEIDLQDLEKNNFKNDDILEINVSADFYKYFGNFYEENKIKKGEAGPDKKLLEIVDKKELEKIRREIAGKKILWRCYVCRAELPPITSDNIEDQLDLFKSGQPKSCPKGHHNQFQITNGKLQFCTAPLSPEELQKYKLAQTIDTQVDKMLE
ncbi:MAG: hypothetical protein ABSA74_04180 [Candidatus Staskawiczbacteria bacterium]|jgi:hypothetical protein